MPPVGSGRPLSVGAINREANRPRPPRKKPGLHEVLDKNRHKAMDPIKWQGAIPGKEKRPAPKVRGLDPEVLHQMQRPLVGLRLGGRVE